MRDLGKCRILVTPRSLGEYDPALRKKLEATLGEVIITPHMGAHTDQAVNEMGWTALGDCLAVL